MKKRLVVVSALLVLVLLGVSFGHGQGQFLAGAAFINLGLRLQDHQREFDFKHPNEELTPQQVWDEFISANGMASAVRQRFPRSVQHPVMAMLVCMDARLDTAELAGDARRNAYIVRTAGSVLNEKEEEMLELAVANGVKLIVLTRHSDCAAERVAADPALRGQFPALAAAVDERQRRVAEFLARPAIKQRIERGQLLVKQLEVDTLTEHVDEVRTALDEVPVSAGAVRALADAPLRPETPLGAAQ